MNEVIVEADEFGMSLSLGLIYTIEDDFQDFHNSFQFPGSFIAGTAMSLPDVFVRMPSRGIFTVLRAHRRNSKTGHPTRASQVLAHRQMCRGCLKSNMVPQRLAPKICTRVLGVDKHNEDLLSTSSNHARH